MARIDHTNCTHARTPAGRRACRAGNAITSDQAGRMDMPLGVDYIGDHIRKTAANGAMKARMDRSYDEVKITGPVARRMAKQAMAADNARIQPRRSGARVDARNASCVQAALHTPGTIRCACGWGQEMLIS